MRPEEGEQLLVRAQLLLGETGRRRAADEGRGEELRRDHAGHVGVDADQLRRRRLGGRRVAPAARHHVDHNRAPVAALRHEPLIAQALHELDVRLADAHGIPAGGGRLAGEPVPRHRRDHHVEGIRRARAVRGGIGERADELQLLDDRAGPAVTDDQRERVLVLGANMDEVDVEPVDLGDEVREGLQPRLALAPVVLGRPVAGEVLHDREGHALRVVLDGLPLGEARRGDARPQVLELRVGNLDRERADRGVARPSFR